MDDITDLEVDSERNGLAQCCELVDDEAPELSDEQVEAIRQHAQAMAHVLVEIFLNADSEAEPSSKHVQLALTDRRR